MSEASLKLSILALSLVVLSILFSSISFALISITPFPIDLGDTDRGSNITENKFNITNTGNATLDSLVISSEAASKYNLKFNTTNISSIPAGSQVTVAYNITIPTDELVSNHSLASLNVFTSNLSNSTSFIANVKGRLKITDIDVDVDGKGSANLQNGAKITQEARPRSIVRFNLEVENTFPNREPEIEIEDIQVTVTIEEIDDGDDLEHESETFDLKPERRKSSDFRFDIPAKVSEDDYTVRILAEGSTDEDAEERVEMTLILEVEKRSHDILITSSKLEPTTVACARNAQLDVTITNVGDEDERLAYILVDAPQLKYRNHATEIELFADPDDDDNIAAKNFTIPIPRGTEPGNYNIEVRVYDDNNDVRDFVKHVLTVQKCVLDETSSTEQKLQEKETKDKETQANEEHGETIPILTEEQKPSADNILSALSAFTESPLYLPLLGLIALIFLIAAVVIVIRFVKR